jgi:hypothetical protein
MRKDILGTWQSLLSQILFLLHADQRLCIVKTMYVCVHTHTRISDCVQTVYELLLLPNNVASETFLHKSGTVRSVDFRDLFHLPTLMYNSFIH